MTDHSTTLLQVAALDCAFCPDGVPLLKNVNLSVFEGEVVVVIGASGTGKTTLVELLFNLTDGMFWRGNVKLDRDRAALVLQRPAVFDHLDVRTNIELVRDSETERPGGEDAAGLLTLVNLPDSLLDCSTTVLSGGQKQRLCIARALAAGRSLLVFDEPTAGLDSSNIASLSALLRQIAREGGRGSLVVTHDLQLTAGVADRVLVLEEGSLVPLVAWGPEEQHLSEQETDRRHRELIRLTRERRWADAVPSGPQHERGLIVAIRQVLLGIGDHICLALRTLQAIPTSLRKKKNFWRMTRQTFWRGGITGIPFFALIGALLGAIVIAVLFGASPLSPRLLLSYLKANHITALSPALAGFLFAARSGSTLVSWVGVMTLGRQLDAMETIGLEPRTYVHAPVWIGTALSYVCSFAAFFGAMWLGTYWMARFYYGVADVASNLDPFGMAFLVQHARVKVVVYTLSIPTIILFFGLVRKRKSEDVAHDVARQAIVASLFVVAIELLLALDIEPSQVLGEIIS